MPKTCPTASARRLRARSPALFDRSGNRLGGTGEYVVVLWPQPAADAADAILEVFRRGGSGGWESVQAVPVVQRRSGPAARLSGAGAPRAAQGRGPGG